MSGDMPLAYFACNCQIWPISVLDGRGYCGHCHTKADKPSTRDDFELQEDLRDEGLWRRGDIVGEGDLNWR